jgi:hypothetical protein
LIHDLYVWNGKESAPLTKASALAYGYKLERFLRNDVVYLLIQQEKVPLSSIFSNDLGNISPRSASRIHLVVQMLQSVMSETTPGSRMGTSRYHILQMFAKQNPETSRENSPKGSRPIVPQLSLRKRNKPPLREDADWNTVCDYYASWSPGELIQHFDPICSKITGMRSYLNIPQISLQIDRIYLGSRVPAENKEQLKKYEITHILNCAGTAVKCYFPGIYGIKINLLLIRNIIRRIQI